MTNIVEAIKDPGLFGPSFERDSLETWEAVLSAAFALPLTDNQREIFRRVAGGREPPESRVREFYAVLGRRTNKTKLWTAVAIYLGTVGAELDGTLDKLSPGERAVVGLLSVDRAQSKIAMGYARGMIEASPVLSNMVERINADSLDLANGVTIQIQTNSYRAIRGRTLIAVVGDELSFWRSDLTVNPDKEVYRAALPGLATTGGLFIGISTPYAKRGLLYDKYAKHYGKPGDVLVVQGSTLEFNPTLDEQIITDALADDPESAQAEWLGQFRTDVEAFLGREVMEQATRPSPLEIPYDRKNSYSAFVDPSGGGQDEFTLAIGHADGPRAIVDLVRGRRGTPAAIVAEYAEVLKAYGLGSVTGDRYGGSWPSDEFRRHGIQYRAAEKPKSDLYQDALAAINSGRVEIPPDDKLFNQFLGLERRTSRAGKDSIDHGPGGHDDRANAVAGLVTLATKRKPQGPLVGRYGFASGPDDNIQRGYRMNRYR